MLSLPSLRNLYSHSTIYVCYITFFSYLISYLFPVYYLNNTIQHFIRSEFSDRFKLAIGQFFVHRFFLIPARSSKHYADWLPKYIFYPAVMICNVMLTYHIKMLCESIVGQLNSRTYRDSLGLSVICDFTVLIIWFSVLVSRWVSYTFGVICSWFKLAW
jgi:hypothetical protein